MPSLPNNAAVLTAITGMSVSGVTRHYDEPPQNLNEGDLPAAFPTMPGAALGDRISTCIADSKTRSVGYVICINPFAIDTNAGNYAQIAGMMDNLETAINTSFTTVANFYDFEMTSGRYDVAGTAYWAINAVITIRSSY